MRSAQVVGQQGGLDVVPLSVFEGVDYVALGHIHGRQQLAPRVRYAGAPLHYSFGEGDITTPFGGYKQSGFGGRDNSIHAHDQYTQLKTIWLDLTDHSDAALD